MKAIKSNYDTKFLMNLRLKVINFVLNLCIYKIKTYMNVMCILASNFIIIIKTESGKNCDYIKI